MTTTTTRTVVLERVLLTADRTAVDALTYREARARWASHVRELGYASVPTLLAVDTNAKTARGPRTIATLTLLPHAFNLSDGTRVLTCPSATPGCIDACVLTHGRGRWDSVRLGRYARSSFAATDPVAFLALLGHELERLARKHASRLRVRLNVASDLRWERIIGDTMARVHAIRTRNVRGRRAVSPTFYDYTKLPVVTREASDAYRIVYSVSERAGTLEHAELYVRNGGSAALVLDVPKGSPVPAQVLGLPTVDGDVDDDRTSDPAGVWVILRAKGDAIGDTSGFVYRTAEVATA